MNKINYILFIATILFSVLVYAVPVTYTDYTIADSFRQGGSQPVCEGMVFNVFTHATLNKVMKLSGSTANTTHLYNFTDIGNPILLATSYNIGNNASFNIPLNTQDTYVVCVDNNDGTNYIQGFDDFSTPVNGNNLQWSESLTDIYGFPDNSYVREIQGIVTTVDCNESWQINYTACDGAYMNLSYYDANECHTYNSLPSDNGTSQHCAICNRQCKDKETPYTNCCILFPIGNFSNYEILDNKLNIITAGTTYPTSLLNQNYLIFNEPVGIYHIIINDGVNYFTTDIEVTESNIYDSVTNIFAVAIIILSLIAILYFVNKKKSQS